MTLLATPDATVTLHWWRKQLRFGYAHNDGRTEALTIEPLLETISEFRCVSILA